MNKPLKDKEREYYIDAEEYASLPPEESGGWMPLDKKYERVPIWCIVALSFAALCGILYLIICLNTNFADFFNLYVSGIFRFLSAKITGIFPFSVSEALIILTPIILFLIIRYVWKYRCNTTKSTLVTIVCILAIVSLFLSNFVLCFSAGYRTTRLDKKLGLESAPISKEELYDTAIFLADEINALVPEIEYGKDHLSVMPYSFSKMNDKLIDAYQRFSEKHDFIKSFDSKLKPVLLSEAMSYAHITGVYTFFTGEANLNIAFPDYTIPNTAAHELSHQRGIAREDEANMMAFLVCMESDDVYIRYSALVSIYEDVSNALYSADRELLKKAHSRLDTRAYNELVAKNEFFKKYQHSVSSQVSGTVNDIYLQSQGTVGQKSYGMVVDLLVAYLKVEKKIK